MERMVRAGRRGMVMGANVSVLLRALQDEDSTPHVGAEQHEGVLGRLVAIAVLEKAASENPEMTLAEFLANYGSPFSA